MNAAIPSEIVQSSTDRLKITEIFLSLQGEAASVGWPTVFVRLTGCPLRCQYCDTAYAFHGGEWRDIGDIVAEVGSHGVRHVCVTGGEPLSQKRCLVLLRALCDAGGRPAQGRAGRDRGHRGQAVKRENQKEKGETACFSLSFCARTRYNIQINI